MLLPFPPHKIISGQTSETEVWKQVLAQDRYRRRRQELTSQQGTPLPTWRRGGGGLRQTPSCLELETEGGQENAWFRGRSKGQIQAKKNLGFSSTIHPKRLILKF